MYYLVECIIIKNENQYLLEHLQHSLQAGIEHIYIYDNLSIVPVSEFLKGSKFEDKCTIEVWKDTENNQIDCYLHFIEEHRKDAKWCAFFDTDELCEGNLKDFCKANEDYIALRFHQIIHGNNGKAYIPQGSLTDNYQEHIIKNMVMYKLVSQLEFLEKQYPHHSYISNERAKDIPFYKWLKVIGINEQFQLHHYFFKSFEEWLQKINRGSVFGEKSGWRLKMFFEENFVNKEDKKALLKKYGLSEESIMDYGAKN